METSKERVVIDRTGRSATLGETVRDPETGSSYETVQTGDGRTVLVLSSLFQRQADGSMMIPLDFEQLDQQQTLTAGTTTVALQEAGELVLPIIEEFVQVGKRTVERGVVRVHKRIVERQEAVSQTLQHQDVEIERVPINQIAQAITGNREDGDTLIIPIYEEVVVVEKRLMLKEELHIHRRQRTTDWNEQITLRREEIDVERVPTDAGTQVDDHRSAR